MFGYACHNTTLGFMKFCGDYAGYAQEELEKAHPGTVALFMNGCSGDQNPQPRGTLDLAQHHGKTLALAVEAGLLTPPSVRLQAPDQGGVRARGSRLRHAADPEQLEERLQSKNTYEVEHAKRLLAILDHEGKLETSYPYPVQVIHFGNDIAMVALGGEVVVDYCPAHQAELGKPVGLGGGLLERRDGLHSQPARAQGGRLRRRRRDDLRLTSRTVERQGGGDDHGGGDAVERDARGKMNNGRHCEMLEQTGLSR